MNNLKNIHLLWIIAISSAVTVLVCLMYLFSERSNRNYITQLETGVMNAEKNHTSDASTLRRDIDEFRLQFDLLRRSVQSIGERLARLEQMLDDHRKRLDAIDAGVPRPGQPAASPNPGTSPIPLTPQSDDKPDVNVGTTGVKAKPGKKKVE